MAMDFSTMNALMQEDSKRYMLRYMRKENGVLVDESVDMRDTMCDFVEHITQFSKKHRYTQVVILSVDIQTIRRQFVAMDKKMPITSYGLEYNGCEYMLFDISSREKRDAVDMQLRGMQLDCVVVNGSDATLKNGNLYYRIISQLRDVHPLSYYEHRGKHNLVAFLSFGYTLLSAIVVAIIVAWGASTFNWNIGECFVAIVVLYTPSMLLKIAIDILNNQIWE